MSALTERLRVLSEAVTVCRWSEFAMRVPAEPERDADFVLLYAAERIDELEAQLFIARADATSNDEDAKLARVAMNFVDRANDVHTGIDGAETICAEFVQAMQVVLEANVAGRDALPLYEVMELGPMPAFPSIRGAS